MIKGLLRLLPAFYACLAGAVCSAQPKYWTVTPTAAPVANWQSIACSADGTKIFAIQRDDNNHSYFSVSTNSGNTWSFTGGALSRWGVSVACSADGGRLLAKLDGNFLSTSTNLGASWSSGGPVGQYCIALAASADGSRLLAADLPGPIYTSTNSGVSWKTNDVPLTFWRRAFSSADGLRLLASAYDQPGFSFSADGGNTWSNHLDFGSQPPGYISAASSDLGILVALNGSIYISTNFGVTWTATSAPNTNWSLATCSADGSKIVAAIDGGPLYISTDSGGSWTPVLSPNSSWSALACSADGITVYAAVNGFGPANDEALAGDIYRLVQTSVVLSAADVPVTNWNAMASSADGVKVFATASYGYLVPSQSYGTIFSSTNGGSSWGATAAPSDSWKSIFTTADGYKVAAVSEGALYVSTNSGKTWTQRLSPSSSNYALAGSADGQKLFVAGSHDLIYRSTDFGLTWQTTPAVNADWHSVACSVDGIKVVAAARNGLLYLSTNSGTSWAPSSAPAGTWWTVCSSADGTKLAAVQSSGGVHLSVDSGATWKLAPLPFQWSWASVSCSSDGSRLAVTAVLPQERVYLSSDSGATWIPPVIPNERRFLGQILLSADGNELTLGSAGALYTWQAPPTLNITASGVGAHVSWRAAASGFVLQESTNAFGGNWTDVTASVAIMNGQNQVMVSPSALPVVYRLQGR